MRSAASFLWYLLLTPPALLLIVAFAVYRLAQMAFRHFLLPHPRQSVRGWCTIPKY